MNRRNAVIAALAAIVGLTTGRARARSFAVVNSNSITIPKGAVSMDLDAFTDFEFTLGKETVKLTPAEIMAALKTQ